MKPYHKIETVYKRDPETKFRTLLIGEYAIEAFELLSDCQWVFTEKIDGTNIRIHWNGGKVRFGGRTDNAQIPAFLIDVLMEMFPPEKMLSVFGDQGNLTLYGEGYGAGIQKGGGSYISDGVSFILFDIAGGDIWFERPATEDFARELDVKYVPIVGTGTLQDALNMVQEGFHSDVGTRLAEGLVMRPYVELRTRLGHRVITKLKHKDFVR